MRRTVPSFVLAFASLLAAATSQVAWNKLTPTTSPSMRRAGAMAQDGTGAATRMLIQGGLTQTPATILAETWTWNGTAWTQQTAAGGPARFGHRIVRLPTANQLLTFGGRSPTISALANDTWRWNGTVWSSLATQGATPNAIPSARFRYGMAFDSVRNKLVLFGGRTATTTLGDTWELDFATTPATWTQVATSVAPPPREDMFFEFDPTLNRVVMYGGYDTDTDTLLGDTWEFDGTEWRDATPLVPPVDAPPALLRTAGAYDSARQRLYLYGGFDGLTFSTATYEYTGDRWSPVTVGAGPTASTEMYAGYDAQRRKFVAFGGVGFVFSNETWEFNGTGAGNSTTPIVGMFGDGCATSVGVAEGRVVATNQPVVNTTYQIEWTGLPDPDDTLPDTPIAAILFHGLSNRTFQAITLPFELSLIGLSGCNLLVSPDISEIVVGTDTSITTSLFLPATAPSLINVALYSQILIPDANATNGVGGTSRGVRAVIGS